MFCFWIPRLYTIQFSHRWSRILPKQWVHGMVSFEHSCIWWRYFEASLATKHPMVFFRNSNSIPTNRKVLESWICHWLFEVMDIKIPLIVIPNEAMKSDDDPRPKISMGWCFTVLPSFLVRHPDIFHQCKILGQKISPSWCCCSHCLVYESCKLWGISSKRFPWGRI